MDCGLPAFTTVLPLNYRRELRKIWTGRLIDPRKCDRCCSPSTLLTKHQICTERNFLFRELSLTRELIEALPENLKMKVSHSSSLIPRC